MIENNAIEMRKLRVIVIASVKLGWFKCCFTDRFWTLHYFNEQTPLVTGTYIDENTEFPFEGYLNCASFKINSEISRIDISVSLGQIDQNGESLFDVYSSQLK